MNAERFEHLAMAYGGDIRRWPAADQPAAFAHLEASEAAQGVLLQAAALDAALNANAPMSAGGFLRERLIAQAPRPRPVWTRASAWASGLAMAAACAAGVFFGATNTSLLTPHVRSVVTTAVATASVPPEVVQASLRAEKAKQASTAETETAIDGSGIYYGGDWFSGLEESAG